MVEADDLAGAAKQAESVQATTQKEIDAERREMAAEVARLQDELQRSGTQRDAILAEVSPAVLATYQAIAAKRRGVAVAEARNGICTICQVRLRPQVYNDILRNDSIVQCDSCQRILYSASTTPSPDASAPA